MDSSRERSGKYPWVAAQVMISMCRSRSSSANVPGMSPPMRRCSSHIRSYTSSQKSVSWTASLTPRCSKYWRVSPQLRRTVS